MEEEADTGGGSKGKEEELEIIDSSEDTIDRLLNKKKPVVVKGITLFDLCLLSDRYFLFLFIFF